MRDSPLYTVGFAALVCVVCAVLVSASAVLLRPRQAENRELDRQKKVLAVAGVTGPRERLRAAEVRRRFAARAHAHVVELDSGQLLPHDGAPVDLGETVPAPQNNAGLVRLPVRAVVYSVRRDDGPDTLVLPVEGKGLWSTIRGFIALDADDLVTVRGIEFYEHGETPGLGGEIDNPRWKAGWQGRLAFDERGDPALHVARRAVGPPEEYPYGVDALTGATITGNGVTNLLRFWLGKDGFGPFLARLRKAGSAL